MEEEKEAQDTFKVERKRTSKIEDDSLFQKHCNTPLGQIGIDDLKLLLDLFFKKAGINMGKETYDVSSDAIDAIIEFMLKDFSSIPILYVASAFMRGSLGQFGPGRLVPTTVYKWMHEITLEYDKKQRHDKLTQSDYSQSEDLHKYPCGKAINMKIDWFLSGKITLHDWDMLPLKEIAERIGQGLDVVPELWGVKSKQVKQSIN